jgi:hypothetical protein
MGQYRPKASGARPSLAAKSAQGAGAVVRAEHGHRARARPGQRGGQRTMRSSPPACAWRGGGSG